MKPANSKTESLSRSWDTLAALLLLCTILTAATRLVITQWTEDLHTIQLITLLGGILGLALGHSRLSRKVSLLLSLGYGFFLILFYLAAPMSHLIPWKERVILVGHRLQSTFTLLAQSDPVNDNIFFLLMMSLLFWAFSVFAGFSITRSSAPWRAAIPAGLALIVIHAYDPLVPRRAWFLAAYLLFALLLVARMHYGSQRHQWQQNHTYVPPDIGFDWIRYTLAAAMVLIVFAWTAPALADTLPAARAAWHRARQPWDDFSSRASNAFNSLQASVGIVHEQYGSSMALGRGQPLSDQLVMLVEAPPRQIPGQRYYWRAYAYDHYENGSWSSTMEEYEKVVSPDDRVLAFANTTGRVLSTFKFIPQSAIVTLYTPSQPVWVDVPVRPQLVIDPDGTADVVAMNSTGIVMPGRAYEVRASMPAVTIADLRQAGDEYPEWILERYTQLPPEITERTHELARRISEGLETPYDITSSVTDYLRGYNYQEAMPPLPTERELVDWFLFDYQAGFCQYYASAQVILLRSLGIPARLAVGYAQGEYEGRGADTPPQVTQPDPEDFTDRGGVYSVRSRNAHAWPEVYFPGVGWVEFEPTTSESAITRPSGDSQANENEASREQEANEREWERLQHLMDDAFEDDFDPFAYRAGLEEQGPGSNRTYWWTAASLLMVSAAVYFWRRRGPTFNLQPLPIRLERGLRKLGINPPEFLRRWSYRASLSPFTSAYMEINRSLRRLGSPPDVDDTPSERGESLIQLLPAAHESVHTLVEQYQLSIYSRRPTDIFAARRAEVEIRKLSYQTFLRGLFGRKDPVERKAQT
jgi:transglutaminase-like putative cysteine protease